MHLDLTAHLRATTRAVSTTTREGAELRLVTATRTYDAPPDEVWDALTTADRIARWFMPVSGDLEVGGRFQLEGQAGGDVLACEPPERLSVSWEFAEQVSWVDVTLRPIDGGTLLQLDHALPQDAHWTDFGPGATGIGWEMGFMGLGEHLAAPSAPRPGPEDLPDLRPYFREAGAAWGEADAAGGADPDAAAAAAQRCVAAYTGEA